MQETLIYFWVGKTHWRRNRLPTPVFSGFRCGSAGKESACSVGALGSIPGLGRSSREGKGYPLQYSGLENSMGYTVHGVAKSQTRLSDFTYLTYMHPSVCESIISNTRYRGNLNGIYTQWNTIQPKKE